VTRRNQRNDIIAKQFHGTLPKSIRAELLQLALYAWPPISWPTRRSPGW
jgi:hypothetical protein